ncbi:tyrosine-type recombinase/integrase [Geomonas sp. Red32]|uniref:tyrosine-type recombinase/integrase n=1 Tax=Geomonas sp. Red32 TaxID=2912856 RepID=UPI00202CCE8F|nr:tyrosine-type recombinase/integrase [Geomonas sp. Red32]MCM0082972.1 tyrosine-type recombinase/integrase [Geomonas sp. Red32]
MRKKEFNLQAVDAKPTYGSIVKMKRSEFLYIDMYYHERRIQMSSGLADTAGNRDQLTTFLNKTGEKIANRTFCFATTFPDADLETRRFFTEKEQRQFHPDPQHVLFGDYARKWMKTVLPQYSNSKQVDYRQILTYWLIPKLSRVPFSTITGPYLRDMVNSLKQKEGKNKGKPLSAHRKRNILSPLKTIWRDARGEHQWVQLLEPFTMAQEAISLQSEQEEKAEREIFLFGEWQAFLACMEPFYLPLTEIQSLTGLIASELLGLRKADVTEKFLYVRSSISRGVEKMGGKTQYRKREIPMTAAMKRCLDAAMAASPNEYVFSLPSGKRVSFSTYRNVWDRSLKAAGLTNKTPYSTRHSLVQWSLVAGMTPVRLVEIMGHRDKQMIFGVYGRYRHGLVEERRDIIEYLGWDYLAPERAAALAFHSETHSETQGPISANCPQAVWF